MVNRIGKFYISHLLIRDNIEEVAEVFSQLRFVPVRVESLFVPDKIEYVGYSHLFREIEENYQAPEYDIIVTKNEDDIISVKVEEVKK